MRTDILKQKEKIIKWVDEGKSKNFMEQQLNCRPAVLNAYLKKMGITYSGIARNTRGQRNKRKDAYEYANSKFVKSSTLKQKLIEDGLKEAKCEQCQLVKWNGKPIPLELHHEDGNRFNNSFVNLKILCPNCHAQTPNYCSKNNSQIAE